MAVVEVYELDNTGLFGWACECGEQQEPVLDRDHARAEAAEHCAAPHPPRQRFTTFRRRRR